MFTYNLELSVLRNVLTISQCTVYVVDTRTTQPPVGCDQTQYYRCNEGTCIDINLRCNREYDCQDGTDEFDCRKLSLPDIYVIK